MLYVLGAGIDRPVAIHRLGYGEVPHREDGNQVYVAWAPFTIWPIRDQSGYTTLGGFPNGARASCKPSPVGGKVCVRWDWRSGWSEQQITSPTIHFGWMGSLSDDKVESSGLKYRRHRFYDPVTGRFTQEDPIGIRGGLNAYGYADGDRVNRSDPSGLCPAVPQLCTAALGALIGGGAQLIYNIATDRPLTQNVGKSMLVGGAVGLTFGVAMPEAAGYFAAQLGGGTLLAAGAAPVLASGQGREMLREAVDLMKRMPPDARVGAFRDFATQISQVNPNWSATQVAATNATIFVGEGGPAMVFNGAGQMFTGSITNTAAFTLQGSQYVVNFAALKPIN